MSEAEQSLRVIVVGPARPPMGGIVRYAEDVMQSSLSSVHRLTLFQDNIPAGLRPNVRTVGRTWNIFGRDGFFPTLKVIRFVFQKMWQLDRALAKEKVDVLHVLSTAGYGFFRNTFHVLIARRRGVKTVFHLLGQIDDLYREGNKIIKAMVSMSLNRADLLVVQSPGLAEYVQTMTKKQVVPIWNGVRLTELAPPDGYAHSDGAFVRVVTLGYLGFQKGTFDILSAMARMGSSMNAFRFSFIGGGQVEKFRAIAREKEIEGCVEFLGDISDADRVRHLHRSDVFLLPSHAEGQPIALLEAMASGLPVISSKVGSIPEVVGSENGFLVTPGDVSAIVDFLGRLGNDRPLREKMGRANVRAAQNKFNLERVMGEIDQVYRRVVDGPCR
jgi:glycosyltransferase involved in cell wall biosynthesis